MRNNNQTDKVLNKIDAFGELARKYEWFLRGVAFRSIGGNASATILFVDKFGRELKFEV